MPLVWTRPARYISLGRRRPSGAPTYGVIDRHVVASASPGRAYQRRRRCSCLARCASAHACASDHEGTHQRPPVPRMRAGGTELMRSFWVEGDELAPLSPSSSICNVGGSCDHRPKPRRHHVGPRTTGRPLCSSSCGSAPSPWEPLSVPPMRPGRLGFGSLAQRNAPGGPSSPGLLGSRRACAPQAGVVPQPWARLQVARCADSAGSLSRGGGGGCRRAGRWWRQGGASTGGRLGRRGGRGRS